MIKLAIRIDVRDNTAMAIDALSPGEMISVLSDEAAEIDRLTVREEVPLPYHKVALTDIHAGDPVLKYGEVIGYASVPIRRGDWVHLHNLASAGFYQAVTAEGEAHG